MTCSLIQLHLLTSQAIIRCWGLSCHIGVHLKLHIDELKDGYVVPVHVSVSCMHVIVWRKRSFDDDEKEKGRERETCHSTTESTEHHANQHHPDCNHWVTQDLD